MASVPGTKKMWGDSLFWGVSDEYDPQWLLTEKQKTIQQNLIELCRTTIRPNAVVSDKNYEYPRKNLNALASQGLLGLIVPTELGGLGENHVCMVMVVETIARYGCPSTAMVFVMHLSAVGTMLFRHHDNTHIQNLLRRLDKEKLVGTLSYSDPATGGHFWYSLSSKVARKEDGSFQVLKFGSWVTSAGFADFYVLQTISPEFGGDFSNMSGFLAYKDEVRANTSDWSAMGMHGNQSGPMVTEGIFQKERLIGYTGEGSLVNDEIVDPFFLMLTSSCWNGISMGCVDIGRKHVTQKRHADVGMRVADYPTIQDYFGETMSTTNASRMLTFSVAEGIDRASGNCDWSKHTDLKFSPRYGFLHWAWQLKFISAKNVNKVSNTMLHTCGGTGYKTDLGLERLLRDGAAAWVMGPSNEVLRQFVGNTVLMGMEVLDYWAQRPALRMVHTEVKKMSTDQKRHLAERLMKEVALEEKGEIPKLNDYQDTEFDNPFATAPASTIQMDKKTALTPKGFTSLKLAERIDMNEDEARFRFSLPDSLTHTGCLPGQYVQIRVISSDGKSHDRYMSPMTRPDDMGILELGVKFESHGVVSNVLRTLKAGDSIDFRGPCGGYEYHPEAVDHLVFICSGSGATPAIQIIRSIIANPADGTTIALIYHAKTEEELLCKEELDGYASKDQRMTVQYTLDEADVNWKGAEGNFTLQMIQAGIHPGNGKSHRVVICGGPHTAITALQLLYEEQYPSNGIFVYGPFGVELLRSVYGRNAHLSPHSDTWDRTEN